MLVKFLLSVRIARPDQLGEGAALEQRVAVDHHDYLGVGQLHARVEGSRLARVKADTGSGDVVLRLAPDASFEAHADQGSGDLQVLYKDAQPIVRRKEVVGYRRGDARTKIDVDTGSGDLTIEPGV